MHTVIKNVTATLFVLLTFLSAQIKPTVVITGGNDEIFTNMLSENLSKVLLESNRVSKGIGNIDSVKNCFNEIGFKDFGEILASNKPYTLRKDYNLNMVELVGKNQYEVRGIKVRINVEDGDINPNKYMVFTFNKDGLITNVRFSLPSHDYLEILEEGTSEIENEQRKIIIEFLENFGSAYSKKDVEFLENVFSNDALIIVGSVTYKKPEFNDMAKTINLYPEKIVSYRQYNKFDYINKLRTYVFPSNKYINIQFDDIQINKHRTMENVYGIKLKQHWKAEKYEDEGYLFLTIYFWEKINPLILVRVWQDVDFTGDYDISIYDFDIIE
ncbi:hypothetical protein ACFL5D_02755 [Candidatus Neomarinimicrobiota bacterium]